MLRMPHRRFILELSLILAIKLTLIIALWWAFFSDPVSRVLSEEQFADTMFGIKKRTSYD